MKCYGCKKYISDNSSVCPHCNRQIVKKYKATTKGASNKYISNNHADWVGGTVTKGKGSIAKLEGKKPIKNNSNNVSNKFNNHGKGKYYNTSKGSKNRYITEDSSMLVGSTVSQNKGSFVKLEKKDKTKNLKPIERKDYVNYIDYIEAKKNRELQLHELKDVKMGDEALVTTKVEASNKVKELAKEKRSDSSSSGVTSQSKGFTSTYEEHLLEQVRQNKNKPQPMEIVSVESSQEEQEIEILDESFIPSVQYTQPTVNKGKRNFKFETNVFAYVAVIALWLIAILLLFGTTQNGFYFSQKDSKYNTSSNGDDFEEYRGVSKSGQLGGSSSEGYTSVVYDNQYLSQFTIRTEKDVYNLIISDSNKQKMSCPNGIKKIENKIINSYEITAVNLCEMNEDFALELADVVEYIYDEFPEARNYLTNLTLANVGDQNTFIAAFMPIFTFSTSNSNSGYPVATKTQIILNAKYFLNTEKIKNSVSYGSKSGYFPPNATRSSTVAHEFGHYLSYVALLNYYKTDQLNYVRATETTLLYDVYDDFNAGNFSKMLLEEAFEKHVQYTGSNESFYEFRASISQYAIAKDSNGLYIYDETIAEAFHDYYLNGSNAKAASKAIVEVLKSKL